MPPIEPPDEQWLRLLGGEDVPGVDPDAAREARVLRSVLRENAALERALETFDEEAKRADSSRRRRAVLRGGSMAIAAGFLAIAGVTVWQEANHPPGEGEGAWKRFESGPPVGRPQVLIAAEPKTVASRLAAALRTAGADVVQIDSNEMTVLQGRVSSGADHAEVARAMQAEGLVPPTADSFLVQIVRR